jgi:single-strand DNA-binding protein
MNNVILTGRLVAEPELKTTTTGVEVVSFRIAVNQDYVKDGEERKADFFNVVAWRKTAVFINQYFHKGDGINIVGRLQSRQYEANDGSNRNVVEIVVEKVEFPLSRSQNNRVSTENTYTPTAENPQEVPDATAQQLPIDEDLPF